MSEELIIDGWSVPGVTFSEQDGGKVTLVLDRRIGLTVEAKDFDQVAAFVADVIGHCWGYGAHPRGDVPKDERAALFARAPHPALWPRHYVEITGAVER